MFPTIRKFLFALTVLVAAPFLGEGNQARAGVITAETQSLGGTGATLSNWFAEGERVMSDIVVAAVETVWSWVDENSVLGRLLGHARRGFAGTMNPGDRTEKGLAPPNRIESQSSTICLTNSVTLALPPAISEFYSAISLRLPDPHLSALLRPPR